MPEPAKTGPPNVGDKAPGFHLPSTFARILDWKHDFAGRRHVVLVFHNDDGPGDAKALNPLKVVYSQIKGLGAEVIGVTPLTQRRQMVFTYRQGLQWPFLVDERKEAPTQYGVLKADGKVDFAAFVIDKQGVVRHLQRGGIDVPPILETLQGLAKPPAPPPPKPA